MKPLSQEILAMAGGSDNFRHLRKLTKKELFFYPEANTGDADYKRFMQELLHRRGISTAIQRNLDIKKAHREEAHKTLVKSTGELKEAAERIYERRKAEVADAQTFLDEIPENEEAIGQVEVDDWFKKKYIGELWPIITSFKDARLFTCHTHGYDSFLRAEPADIAKDRATFRHAETMAQLSIQDKDPAWLEIREFFSTRILPSKEWRLRFCNAQGIPVPVASLKAELQAEHKKHWKSWARGTKRYGWGDDSGLHYTDEDVK